MKSLEELKVDDVIFVYSILSFPNKEEVMVKTKVKVYKVTPQYNSASTYENFENPNGNTIRRVIKMNEGNVYRNSIWLTEENDELAKDILVNHFKRKIEIMEHEIQLFHNRIDLVNNFSSKEKK
jgi:hypothetical protein